MGLKQHRAHVLRPARLNAKAYRTSAPDGTHAASHKLGEVLYGVQARDLSTYQKAQSHIQVLLPLITKWRCLRCSNVTGFLYSCYANAHRQTSLPHPSQANSISLHLFTARTLCYQPVALRPSRYGRFCFLAV